MNSFSGKCETLNNIVVHVFSKSRKVCDCGQAVNPFKGQKVMVGSADIIDKPNHIDSADA